MRILVTGGGSGGHISPALAVAEKLAKEGVMVGYVGSEDGPEGELARRTGFEFFGVAAGKLRRYWAWENVRDVWRVVKGVGQARKIIKERAPEVVFAAGGFVSLPLGIAAVLEKIPLVISEADSHLGLTTRALAKGASKICLAFPDRGEVLPKEKVVVTGLPLREGVVEAGRRLTGLSASRPTVLVLGGSQGAEFLNTKVKESLGEINEFANVVHQTGKGKERARGEDTSSYLGVEFADLEMMRNMYQTADCAVCRAGANTLFELAAHGVPALMVPLPSAAGDHQSANAKYFAERGCGKVLRQDDLSADKLVKEVKNMLAEKEKYAEGMRQMVAGGALERVCEVIKEAVQK